MTFLPLCGWLCFVLVLMSYMIKDVGQVKSGDARWLESAILLGVLVSNVTAIMIFLASIPVFLASR